LKKLLAKLASAPVKNRETLTEPDPPQQGRKETDPECLYALSFSLSSTHPSADRRYLFAYKLMQITVFLHVELKTKSSNTILKRKSQFGSSYPSFTLQIDIHNLPPVISYLMY